MISESCSIDEFVKAVKDKETWEVITLAVEEATWADRMSYRTRLRSEHQIFCGKEYSHHLKRLIDYLRYAVTPKRRNDESYRLYTTYWGSVQQHCPRA